MGQCKSYLLAPQKPPSHDLRGNMMRERKDSVDVYNYYEVIKTLGEGSMGSVSLVKRRFKSSSELDSFKNNPQIAPGLSLREQNGASPRRLSSSRNGLGQVYALKEIHLSRMTDEFIEELKNEIDILKSLDHPNIVKPIETFDRKRQLYVVMELCSGGDLYSRDPYTEKQSARIAGQLLSAISYMHSRNITHRDLKFENIMFENSDENASIKVIDFGLSKKYIPDSCHLVDGVGTIYTMAPQVLQGLYTHRADLWSCGVIVFMLLCGEMPFFGRKRKHVIDKIMRCDYNFRHDRFDNVSEYAKDFCRGLIEMDPHVRWTSEQALKSKWLAINFDLKQRRPSESVMTGVSDSLKKYGEYGKFQKMALMVIAHQSSLDEIEDLRKAFDQYDSANDGTITFSEFKGALESLNYSDEDIMKMFRSVDIDESGVIHYTEFLAATLEAQGNIEEERLAGAFDRLDADDSGFITKKNLKEILGTSYSREAVDDIMAEADFDKDGKIGYEEFVKMFRGRTEKNVTKMVLLTAHSSDASEELATVDTVIPLG